MKKALIALFFMTGCAALLGQEKYSGTIAVPTLTHERIIHYPEMPKPGMRSEQNDNNDHNPYAWTQEQKQKEAMANYWDLPVEKAATMVNPLDTTINAHIYCYSSFPSIIDMTISAHMSQEMTFTTNATHMYETLCELRSYEVTNATR